jgi:hypothetical protein
MYEDLITALISSSPIPSHPSTAIIEETITSIRHHLPDIPIFIMCDGIREEQKHYREPYNEYRKELVKKMLFDWNGTVMICPFPEFRHQAVMTRSTLEIVKTQLVLLLEHDTPLLLNRPIDWDFLIAAVRSGETNHVRLHYDETIHPEHEYMMRGHLTQNLIRCVQFHNRPALTSAKWLKKLLEDNFTPDSRTWIEDRVYSPISISEWPEYRLTIYDPHGTGDRMKRSTHTCGRGNDTKFDPKF